MQKLLSGVAFTSSEKIVSAILATLCPFLATKPRLTPNFTSLFRKTTPILPAFELCVAFNLTKSRLLFQSTFHGAVN
jgi:hypothetical protein